METITFKPESTASKYNIVVGDLVISGYGPDADLGEILVINEVGEHADVTWTRGACRTFLTLADDDVAVFSPRDFAEARCSLEGRLSQ